MRFFMSLVIVVALATFPVMWLVNGVFSVPFLLFVFGGPLSFWKTFGLSLLLGLLFQRGSTSEK